jgi:ferric-dicitrate binding protein FerR (iron transport regulator)
MSVKNRLWILMGKRLSGSITDIESLELDKLFQIYPDVWYAYEILIGVDDKEIIPDAFIKEIQALLANDDTEVAIEPVLSKTVRKPVLPVWIKVMSAAVILVCFSLGIIQVYNYFRTSIKALSKNNEIIVLNGTKTDVDLPDGSKVILNSGSKLTYSKDYATAHTREVFLSGEAYFKVLHDKKHPFIIHTANFDIRDIGTTFNINAYPGEKTAEASLIEGSIEISFKNSAKKIILQHRQKVVLINNIENKENVASPTTDKEQVNYKIVDLNINKDVKSEFGETAWVNNELVFKNETFDNLAKKMGRKYNVDISFGDDKIKTSNVTGIFKSETVDQALKTLQMITPFKYEINQNKIIILSSGPGE